MENLHFENIIAAFDHREPKPIQKYKNSAVMILLEDIEGELHIIFQVRSNKLNRQPGDVCLPGGRIESGESSREAAIRETMEEMKLNKNYFNIIGEMDYFVSSYGMILYPFVAKVNGPVEDFNEDEVDHIFKVPVNFFINNEPIVYKMQIGPVNNHGFPFHLINGGDKYKFSNGTMEQYFYQWKGYVIWGITAHIVKSFIDIIK